ncbi:nitrite reductase small subunit NirD [Marinobacter bohaiensis]|uniref:nitrite reductase small subunit NirD n=1 Tax=Marinobacter bohaiensis TaxID=2201898 RepID=UPI000DACDEA8|nr:nitrite reductase small subunit NirD [Marinobacter bohaiensis]
MSETQWMHVGERGDLIPESGIAVWTPDGPVAVFYLPGAEPELYAIGHYCPLGQANVLARGIVGDLKGELVVASPLYKQHYSLTSGRCQEDESVSVPTYGVRLNGDALELAVPVTAKEGCAA